MLYGERWSNQTKFKKFLNKWPNPLKCLLQGYCFLWEIFVPGFQSVFTGESRFGFPSSPEPIRMVVLGSLVQLALGQVRAFLDPVQDIAGHALVGPVDGAVAHLGEK